MGSEAKASPTQPDSLSNYACCTVVNEAKNNVNPVVTLRPDSIAQASTYNGSTHYHLLHKAFDLKSIPVTCLKHFLQMTVSVKEIATSATEAANVATEAVTLAVNTDERVKLLGISSRDVRNFVKVINSIAKQAADATDEISKKILAIQQHGEFAINAIGEINLTINTIHDIQTTIASAVEQQSATTREISRSVTEAAKGTGEIAHSIADVAKGAEQSLKQTDNAQVATREQEKLSHVLNTLVSRFKLVSDQ